MGRRPDLNPEKIQQLKNQLVELLYKNPNIEHACKKISVTRQTIYRWMESDTSFSLEVEKACHLGRDTLCDVVENAVIKKAVEEGHFPAQKFILAHNSSRYRQGSQTFMSGHRSTPTTPENNNSLFEAPGSTEFSIEQLEAVVSNPSNLETLVSFACPETAKQENYRQSLIRATGEHSPEFFFEYFLGHWQQGDNGITIPTAEFHRELFQLQQSGNSVCVIPRGHAKTTRGKMRLIWLICYQKVEKFLFWSSEPMVKNVLDSIRREFEDNENIEACFGRLVPDGTKEERRKRWSQKKLVFTNNVEIEGISKFGSIRGQRPDEIWVDDPQENKEIENPEIAKKFYDHFQSGLRPTLKPEGKINVTGTNVGEHCLVKRLMDDETNSYEKITYTAIADLSWKEKEIGEKNAKLKLPIGDNLLWPERYTLEHLQTLYRDMGEDAWLQEFQNIPAVFNGSPVFPKETIFRQVDSDYQLGDISFFNTKKDTTGKIIPQTNCIFGIDLAEGHADGDYSTIVGINREGELVCQFQGRLEQALLVGKLKEIWDLGYRGLIMPERNTGLAFIESLKDHQIFKDNLYRMKHTPKNGKREQGRDFGWNTNESTKNKMISEYKYWLRYTSETIQGIPAPESTDQLQKVELEVSREIIGEIKNYYVDDKGKCNARSGHHDDLLIAHMIACQGLKEPFVPESLPKLEEIGL